MIHKIFKYRNIQFHFELLPIVSTAARDPHYHYRAGLSKQLGPRWLMQPSN